MSLLGAIAQGFRAVRRHPGLVLLLWGAGAAAALPAAWVVGGSIHASAGSSLAAENLRAGFDMDWFGEYRGGARGIESTFTPTQLGAGAFLNNLEGWATGKLFAAPRAVVGIGLLFAVVSAFLLGGIVDRLLRAPGGQDAARLGAACARHFGRFLRLTLLSGACYVALYALHRWADGRLALLTRDLTSERTVLILGAAELAFVAGLLALVQTSASFARIALVAEGRRSALLAALRGAAFVIKNPARTLGLGLAMAAIGGAALAAYAWAAPGAGTSSWASVVLAFAFGQAFLLIRLALRLALLGGQVALFRAHG